MTTHASPRRSISTLLDRIAEVCDTENHLLPPLYQHTDTAVLAKFVSGEVPRDARPLRFTMKGCEVTVEPDGTIDVTPSGSGQHESARDLVVAD